MNYMENMRDKRKLISLEERKQIEQGIKDGLTYREIAQKIGRSFPTISNEVRRFGGPEDYNAEKAQAAAQERMKKNGARGHHLFSPDIINKVIDLKREHKSMMFIATALNISIEKLYKIYNCLPIEKKEEMYTSYEERISNLEMQLEIILEKIQEIYDRN